MIDLSHIKVHIHATGATRDNQDIGHIKRGINSKVYIVVNLRGRVINLKTIAGTTADCDVALDLIKTMKFVNLLVCLGIELMIQIQLLITLKNLA